MRIHLHALCWNDRRMLDFFFRHYEPWVDCFFILDDHSTDGTREYLQARPDVVLGNLERIDPHSWVRSAQHIYNTAWKQSIGEAEWVVVTDIDEHLHHPTIRDYLPDLLVQGVTVVPALGYQMITEDFPSPDSVLWRDYRLGVPWAKMSKVGIFRPHRIRETNYTVGRHKAQFEGEIFLPERDEVVNLHYKYLGIDYTQMRHKALASGLRPVDRAKGWGAQYDWDEGQLRANFERFRSALVDIAEVDHHAEHGEPRWWRRPRRANWWRRPRRAKRTE